MKKDFLNLDNESNYRLFRRIVAVLFLASLPFIAHFAEEQKNRQPVCPTGQYSVNCEVRSTATRTSTRTPVSP